MAAILAVAAGGTAFATMVSESPQFLSKIKALAGGNLSSLLSATKTSDTTHQQQQNDRRFVLIQHEFGWNGTTGGPPIVVNKGDVVQITIINSGLMAHNFGIAKISQQSTDIMKETKNMSLPDRVKSIPYDVMAVMPCPGCQPVFEEGYVTMFIQPGTKQVVTFTASQTGNFKYFCMIRSHLWLGMVGDFIVRNIPATTISTTNGAQIGGGGA
jgi:FtsP/CotA-like multicopper oxidase with cupredoxin domain